MERSEAKFWVDTNIDRLLQLLGIPHWEVTIKYEPLDEGVGYVRFHPKYEHASVTLHYHDIDDVEELERILTHELMHILHAPFQMLWDAVVPYLDRKAEESALEIYSYAKELTVKNLERMHSQHIKLLAKEPDHGEKACPEKDCEVENEIPEWQDAEGPNGRCENEAPSR